MTNTSQAALDKPRRKAYSYLRFSTSEQRKGDSYRRQIEMVQEYARTHDLELDEILTFHDEGISGFRGQNAEIGRLADFKEAVHVGLVPQGSVLLVEQLDRLSRLVPRKAVRVLEDIVEAGVSVVTLNDGREYSPESLDSDPTNLLMSVLTFMRANEESQSKSNRLAQAWVGKRAAASTKPMTSIVPAWLQLNHETGRIEELPERVAVVRRVFDLTLQGTGQHKIAAMFNHEGLATWGVGKKKGLQWHRSYIAKMLANEAVIGNHTPHRMEHAGRTKRKIALEPIPGYFPAIISPETWTQVQALRETKGAPRGRQASAPISNILSQLAKCPKCGSTMTRVQKGKKSTPSLVCTSAKAGAGCEYKSVRYSAVESRILQVLPDMIRDREGLNEVEDVEDRLAELDDMIFACRNQIDELVDLIVIERSHALITRLRDLERELPGMLAEQAAAREHRDVMAGPVVGSRIARAIATLTYSDDEEFDRAKANLALRGLFKQAIINWPKGTIDLEWQLGGICRIHYAWTEGAWPPADSDDGVTGPRH
jgi:DNA invertase Pin-like site-specific DNA recombinase